MTARRSHGKLGLVIAGIAAVALLGGIAIHIATRPSPPPGPGASAEAPQAPSAATTDSPPTPAEEPCPIQFREVTGQTGIAFRHTDGSSGRHYIVETVAAGLASFDYDGDGLIDLYFLNGRPLPGTPRVDPPPRNALYRNLGGFRFEDVTDKARVGNAGYGLGVCIGDYDNDGHPDIYVSNFGPKVLYHNNGDGTFTDVTAQAGVADGDKVGAGVCFLDADGDGRLDLYVANYVKFSFANHVPRELRGVPWYSGPRDYESWPDSFFHNNGNGTFADVSRESGVASVVGPGMGMVCLDYDNDGATDVFVGNDARGNFLFHNDGTGKFREVGLAAGVAFNMYGAENGTMGADCGDYDRDGRLDLFITDYQTDLPVLYRNLGTGTFEDVTLRTGAAAGSWQFVKWGTGLVDFDNDGNQDLFVACGHLQDNVDRVDDSTAYKNHNIVLRNLGGRFVNVSGPSGLDALAKHSARGAVFDDLDNDGDLDVVVLNSREPPTVLRNMYYELGGKNHWLQLKLQGVKTNRDGVGARVRVTSGDLVLIDEVHSGRGYQGHFGSRLHFGLGSHDRVDRIEVRWIGGGVDVVEPVAANQILTITEGLGLDKNRPSPIATDAELGQLKGLAGLKRLSVGKRITDAGLDAIKSLAGLEQLDLAGNPITDDGLRKLAGLKNLRRLDLSNTAISDAGLKHLAGLTQLEELYCYRTALSDACVDSLKGLKHLKTLDLTATKTSQKGLDSLKKELPNTTIFRW
jgi:hypothetical protein